MILKGRVCMSEAAVTLGTLPAMARFVLRARSAEAIARISGGPAPTRIGETAGGLTCLGPDEWYARLPAGAALAVGEGEIASVVEVSARAVGLALSGIRAWEVLNAGCPLDLQNFPVGRAVRTIYESVEIILWRVGETRFEIDVWRSFAPWLAGAFAAAIEAL
jgi:sarcosine oxidase, subunit gamma